MPPLGFAAENCLFFGEWLSSETFLRAWVDVFWTLAKKLQQIVKFVFYLSRETLLRKVIFSNKKVFTEFFQNVERCRTLAMNLRTIVKNAFHLSRGTFREKFVFRKNIKCSITFFRIRETLSLAIWGKIVRLAEKYHHGCQNWTPRFQSALSRKVSFLDEWMSWNFFSNFWRVFFGLLQKL